MVLLASVWWSDPGWWLAIIFGILGSGAIGVLIYRKQRSRKQIRYQILSDAPIVNIDKRVAEKVKIIYQDEGQNNEVNDANILAMKVWNSGDTDVKIWNTDDAHIEDFEVPIRFQFEGRKIISLTELTTTPSMGVIEEKDIETYLKKPTAEPNMLALPHCFLKPRQSINLSLLLIGPKGELVQKGKLFSGNVKEFDPENRGKISKFVRKHPVLTFIPIAVIFAVFVTALFNALGISSNPNPSTEIIQIDAKFAINSVVKVIDNPNFDIITEGTFPLASEPPSLAAPNGEQFIIIRHKNGNAVVDSVFAIGNSWKSITSDGSYSLSRENKYVVIDVTTGGGTFLQFNE